MPQGYARKTRRSAPPISFPLSQARGDIYYKDNEGRIVKVVGINYVGNNQYTIDTCFVTNENVEGVKIPGKEPVTIESNWDLWRLL